MTSVYTPLEIKIAICKGPSKNTKEDSSTCVKLEKANFMGKEIIFLKDCEKMNKENGSCYFNCENGAKCKYFTMEKEELSKYFNNLNIK